MKHVRVCVCVCVRSYTCFPFARVSFSDEESFLRYVQICFACMYSLYICAYVYVAIDRFQEYVTGMRT
jgi:hypothetical protein